MPFNFFGLYRNNCKHNAFNFNNQHTSKQNIKLDKIVEGASPTLL